MKLRGKTVAIRIKRIISMVTTIISHQTVVGTAITDLTIGAIMA
jgi:hypothetical protein